MVLRGLPIREGVRHTSGSDGAGGVGNEEGGVLGEGQEVDEEAVAIRITCGNWDEDTVPFHRACSTEVGHKSYRHPSCGQWFKS